MAGELGGGSVAGGGPARLDVPSVQVIIATTLYYRWSAAHCRTAYLAAADMEVLELLLGKWNLIIILFKSFELPSQRMRRSRITKLFGALVLCFSDTDEITDSELIFAEETFRVVLWSPRGWRQKFPRYFGRYDLNIDLICPDMRSSTVGREKMDVIASKMEDLARCVVTVLSDNVKNPKDSALPREAPSVLCLTLYNCNKLKTRWGEFGTTDRPDSYALSVHLSGRDQEICLRNLGGSTFFNLPAGSALVTIGKQIQEWSNGEFKSAVGEILFELTDEPNPFMSLELLYSPGDLRLCEVGRHASCIDRPPKTVPLRDQIFIALVLLVLYYLFW
ncbi:hypothetical protein TRIUR3_16661 [Triticum urartu]|uniref:Uncharacterized protein n=1 Tax=Triticum urartu TaxID=4572 RepID=M7YNV7_TRIUA|nr:hypothetical protein TRIUR3_16661 [Triticum urartu]